MSGMVGLRTLPVQVLVPGRIVSVASGAWSAYALQDDGTVWSWGDNEFGQLGNGTALKVRELGSKPHRPQKVSGVEGAVAIAACGSTAYALISDGTVLGWGANQHGQIGAGISDDQSVSPLRVKGLTDVAAIAANSSSAIALKKDGSVWAWGSNEYGELGDGTRESRAVARCVKKLVGVTAIATCEGTAYAVVGDRPVSSSYS